MALVEQAGDVTLDGSARAGEPDHRGRRASVSFEFGSFEDQAPGTFSRRLDRGQTAAFQQPDIRKHECRRCGGDAGSPLAWTELLDLEQHRQRGRNPGADMEPSGLWTLSSPCARGRPRERCNTRSRQARRARECSRFMEREKHRHVRCCRTPARSRHEAFDIPT